MNGPKNTRNVCHQARQGGRERVKCAVAVEGIDLTLFCCLVFFSMGRHLARDPTADT